MHNVIYNSSLVTALRGCFRFSFFEGGALVRKRVYLGSFEHFKASDRAAVAMLVCTLRIQLSQM